MKAIVYHKYGAPEVLHLAQLEKPTPKDNEVLVKVHATTVTAGDIRMRAFDVPRAFWIPSRLFLGITGPRRAVLGMELAGEIESVGKNVTRFKKGDQVFASTFGVNFGGYAEYKCLPEDGIIALKPSNISYEEAAAVPVGAMTALRGIRRTNLQRGQKVLVYGASGSVGSFAVQIAKHFGAEVTGVCSGANVKMVRSLGADHVIDYTTDQLAHTSETYDVVYDAVGKLSPALLKKLLKPTGTFGTVYNAKGPETAEEITYLTALLAADVLKPVIDRCYPLEQTADAHRYVDAGHKKGNVVITIA